MISIFEEHNVRMVWNKDSTEIWFSAPDVGEELGIVNIRKTLINIDKECKKKFTNDMLSAVTNGYTRNFKTQLNNFGEIFISEEAVYNVSFRSNKPEAKLFTKWVTKVLKEIRTNGYFIADNETKKWLNIRQETKEVRKQETNMIQQFINYATAQGSTNAKKYYIHFTNVVHKRCGIITGERDKADQKTLLQLKSLETLVEIRLETLMKTGMHYKEIYTSIKDLISTL